MLLKLNEIVTLDEGIKKYAFNCYWLWYIKLYRHLYNWFSSSYILY